MLGAWGGGDTVAVPDAPARTEPAEPAPAAQSWLGPSVRGIGAASLLSDLGHEVPTALLPSFLTSTLGAPAAALGVIEGAVSYTHLTLPTTPYV